VALVADDGFASQLPLTTLTKAAAAIQKQVVRDFGPIWDVTATVDAFGSLDDVPLGYWPILIGSEGQNGGGVHLDRDNQPYALVDFTPDWTVTTSHECLEMLADPFGNRLVPGDSPDPGRPGRVEFLVEVCDPCEVPNLGYTSNGVRVSDFYTPRYFEPAGPSLQAQPKTYDFQGHISSPRQVLKGGYLSWREPDGTWFQELFFGAQPQFKQLGTFDKSFGSLRAWIDSHTSDARTQMLRSQVRSASQVLARISKGGGEENDLVGHATRQRAARLRADIASMRKSWRTPIAGAPSAGRSSIRRTRASASRRRRR
jgi:hypothetical protein